MRVFKNKWFTKFARRHRIGDEVLLEAVERANLGLIDADLGGGVIKQSVARQNQGKSGGFRSVVLFKQLETAVFVYGFAKSDMENISSRELAAYRNIASVVLEFNAAAMEIEVLKGKLIEVSHGKEKIH